MCDFAIPGIKKKIKKSRRNEAVKHIAYAIGLDLMTESAVLPKTNVPYYYTSDFMDESVCLGEAQYSIFDKIEPMDTRESLFGYRQYCIFSKRWTVSQWLARARAKARTQAQAQIQAQMLPQAQSTSSSGLSAPAPTLNQQLLQVLGAIV